MIKTSFKYEEAFSRNLGWITPSELEKLQNTCVAIAGMGGVGGHYLITLTRLGIGRFHVADFDSFEIPNFNRQYGADTSTVGQKKLDVMVEKALLINPNLQIKKFPQGVTSENMNEFLEGVSAYADGLDVFVLQLREKLFSACYQKNIPAFSVAPTGLGAAALQFKPGKMTFDEYFGFSVCKNDLQRFMRFILGFSPWFLSKKSLVDQSYLNPKLQKAPSTPVGIELAAGVMATEIMKSVLNRGPSIHAPCGFHFDAYTYRLKKSWMPFGYRNPFFQLKLKVMEFLINRSP